MTLVMPQPLVEQILAHCQQQYPKEACGMVAGRGPSPEPVVQVYPMRNVEASPIGYSMDPKEQLLADKQMRSRGQRMCAIYHSHTASDAYPSSVDVGLAISPDISYVLVSLKDRQHPVLKSYRIEGRTVTDEPVQIVPG